MRGRRPELGNPEEEKKTTRNDVRRGGTREYKRRWRREGGRERNSRVGRIR